ncbi:MAG: DEAD/DEAH box helicase family protein [Candidatus Microsaccharimonas sp.]
MAERFSGNVPYPLRGTHGSNRRGLAAHQGRAVFESQRAQSALDKQKQIEKFQKRREEQLLLEPRRIDLGNKELAAYKKKTEFQESVRDNKVTLITGATGTGKSTQGIQFLIESGYDHTFALVPRKIIADNLGDRLREELREHFGDAADGMIDIIHGERSERTEGSVATVLTAQTYLRMEKDIRAKYAGMNIALFNDEIHELDLHTEMGVATSAIGVNENPGWRLILASATMDEAFVQATYQGVNEGKTVPIVKIEGRPHAITTFERPDLSVMEAYEQYGDVEKMMSFTSGEKQLEHFIKETTNLLESHEKGSSRNVEFRRLIGTLTNRARARVFTDQVAEGSRLSIISTPAGMSGITNPGNIGVITDGVVNRKELDKYGVEGLKRHYASQAEITQMFGRAGRDVEGGFGVLVKPITVVDDMLRARGIEVDEPEMEFKPFAERDQYPPAQIYSSNLSRIALEAAGLRIRLTDLNPFFQHKVGLADIVKAEKNLLHLGALDAEYKITELGDAMDAFPLSPELSRGLVEAMQPGRTLLHMSRAALIAVAIDAGGLQDFSNKDGRNWEQLVRPTSKDDFIAQLDIMNALQGVTDLERFAGEYNLQPQKVEQAAKTARKVFRVLNIRERDVVFSPPKPEEENLLRDDFTPGMADLVYEKSGKRRRVQQYIHVLGNEGSTQRSISDRSASIDEEYDYIAAFPRWYISRNRQGEQLNQIIDRTLIINPEVLARHVAKIPSLLSAEPLQPHFDGGRVIEQEQFHFGSIKIGEPVPSTHDVIPDASRKLLEHRVLQRPGIAQQSLREIAEELEWFEKTIPKEELDRLKNPDAPALITEASIRELIRQKTAFTRDMHVIDEALSSYIYSENISIQKYYDQEVLTALRARSPKTVIIGKVTVDLHYDHGQPYITRPSVVQRQAPVQDFYLPDGREILLQVSRPASQGGTVRISPRDLIPE